MESVYSTLSLPVSSAMAVRLPASVPRSTRYPVMLASSGSVQLRVTLLWLTPEVVSPVGAAGGCRVISNSASAETTRALSESDTLARAVYAPISHWSEIRASRSSVAPRRTNIHAVLFSKMRSASPMPLPSHTSASLPSRSSTSMR